MKKSLLVRLRSSVISANMCLSICVGTLFLFWFFLTNYITYIKFFGHVTLKEMGENFLYSIYSSHSRSGFDLFAPALAALPAATIFCDDFACGYTKSILLRSRKGKYIDETLICSSLSGGLAIFLPSLLSSIFFIFIGEPNLVENTAAGSVTFLDQSIFSKVQFVWGGGAVVLLLLVLSFLFGASWSNIGLCISTIIPNRYVAIAAPFAIYFGLHIFCFRIEQFIVFSPTNILMPIGTFMPNLVFPFIYQLTLLTASIVWFKKGAIRRLSDD